ncbi:MAG: AraC family transcriptional regulator [Bacteroidia bacterium]|nr:AraC family transcriptional regulator [Bacteroidia bacterium]
MKSDKNISEEKDHSPVKNGAHYFVHHMENTSIPTESHRIDHYAICLLIEGEMQLETNLFFHHAKAPSVFVIAPGVIRRFLDTNKIKKATVIFFDKDYFLKNQANIHFLDKFDFLEQKDQHIIDLDEIQYQKFLTYFQQVEQKAQDTAPHSSDIIRSFIYILLNELEDINSSRSKAQTNVGSRNELLLQEFKMLLTKYFIEERQLTFYAEKLFVTPKHLSAAVKEASGKTAGDWISEMLILESKVLLQNKQSTIAQIAERLKFTDPSHFGKFFKSQTGLSPLVYRNGI